ncbi:MAG: rod shape-determining protein MreD [Candidatus Marinimicrobia bacterium]|nr:rod shape-determining protein MreD [Candidatus Neomarinimicrobiota bacterium]
MRTLVTLFMLWLAAGLQTIWPPWAVLAGARPPWLLGLSVYYALSARPPRALVGALLTGLVQDALSATPMGYSAACHLLLAAFILRVRAEVFVRHWATQALFGALGALTTATALLFLLAPAGAAHWPPGLVLWRLAGWTVAGLLVTPLACALALRLERLLGLGVYVEARP